MYFFIDENGFMSFPNQESEIAEIYEEEVLSEVVFDPDDMLDENGQYDGWSITSI